MRFFYRGGGQALHRSGHLFGDLGQNLGIVVVGGGDHDGLGAGDGFFALLGSFSTSSGVARSFMKIPEPTKMASAPSCIIEGRVGGRGNAAGGEVGHRQLAGLRHHADQLVGRLVLLGRGVELLLGEHGERAHLFA